MKHRYRWFAKADAEGKDQVVCNFRGDGCLTVTVPSTDVPISAARAAALMNNAFEHGYLQAQADIQKALGVSQ